MTQEFSANGAWLWCLKQTLASPVITNINGALGPVTTSHESLGHRLIYNMNYPFVTNKERNLKPHYAMIEAHMILSGSNNLYHSSIIERTLTKWSIDKRYISGAYGPKFIDQMPYLLNAFNQDLNTRRAVINIWRESPGPSLDTPCLLSFQYIIRDNKLNCITTMRSSDVWLGLPNDMASLALVSEGVRLQINEYLKTDLELGIMYNTAGSRHIYINQLEKINKINYDYASNGILLKFNNYDEYMNNLIETENTNGFNKI